MAMEHIVEEGEHMAAVAAKYGMADYRVLWDHPDNAPLRETRSDPFQLVPGDTVSVPDVSPKSFDAATGQRHRFTTRVPVVSLRLRLLDVWGEPRAGLECTLTVRGALHALTTDGDGKLECEVPATATSAVLRFDEVNYELRIGQLRPSELDEGLRARLGNMGYPLPEDGAADLTEMGFAVSLFQWDNDLAIAADDLAAAHGQVRDAFGC